MWEAGIDRAAAFINDGVRVTSPEVSQAGATPSQASRGPGVPHSEVLDKGQGVLERQALDHRRPFRAQGVPGRWHTGCGYGRKLP